MQESQEMPLQSLGMEDPLEEAIATHSVMPGESYGQKEGAWGLWSIGSQRVGMVGNSTHAGVSFSMLMTRPLTHLEKDPQNETVQ